MRFVAGQRPQDAAGARGHARARAQRSRSWRRSPTRSTRRTGAGWCTATSSRPTCCSTRTGHAYLTDFGITKQVGSDSTQTGRDRRHARLPGARADPGRAGRRAHRRVRARLRAVRVPGGHAAVPPRHRDGGDLGAPAGAAAAAARPAAARSGAREGAGQGARRPLRDLHGADRGGAGRARAGRPGGAGDAPPAAGSCRTGERSSPRAWPSSPPPSRPPCSC